MIGLADTLESRTSALSVADLALVLNVNGATIRRHIRAGRIPYFKIGMTIRFDPKQVAGWLREQEI